MAQHGRSDALSLAQRLLRRPPYQILGALLLLLILFATHLPHPSAKGGGVASRLAAPGTAYRGRPWHNERTVAVETLGETKFARCDVHTVMSEDGSSTINDWLFLEEVDAVNIVVHTLEDRFIVFKQRKYAIPGETLSPVGGFIDAGESPLTSAKREVLEELGLGSRRMLRTVREGTPGKTMQLKDIVDVVKGKSSPPAYDKFGLLDGQSRQQPTLDIDNDWVFLGRYRTAANRGGGFLYSYLLKNAVPLLPGGGTTNYAGTGDNEAQEIGYLSKEEVMEALSTGRFGEVKWAATFALSLLHIDGGMPACCGTGGG
ncbi:hypothetical protein ACHAXT_005963 [Thalassiosira profunda]